MNKYTAKQVEDIVYALDDIETHPCEVVRAKRALRDYAALLRERESAKACVTDEMIECAARAMQRKFDPSSSLEDMTANGKWRRFVDEATCCLEAVAPMLASARVPDGWLPIESAPNDGTMHVRGLMVHGNDGKALYWDACAGHLDTEDGKFIDQGGNDFGWNADDFTHWHPLAAATKPETEE